MRRAFALALLLLAWGAAPAHAALTLCNRTSYVLYAATAALNGQKGDASGWTRITPGDCAAARKTTLPNTQYLVHARSSLAHSGPARAWGGSVPLCVKDTDFALPETVPALCKADGSFALSFAPLAMGGGRDKTMTLDENPAYPSLLAAQLAGVKRLLADAGLKPGPINATPDKATGAALAAFRARMHFSPRAGNTELFDALESQALKTAAPAGYTVCNHTAQDLLAALGQRGKAGAISRGWWTVAPGACARIITTPLSGGTVSLLAQHKDGTVVAGGNDRFCTTAVAFEIRGADNCAARGYAGAGFARTPSRGAAGIVAHVGDSGLMPPPQTGMSK